MRDDLDDMGLRKGMGDFEDDEFIPGYVLKAKPTADELLAIQNMPPGKIEIMPPIDYPKPPDTDIQKLIGELKVMRASDAFIKIDRVIGMLEDL